MYTSKSTSHSETIGEFLDKCELPKLGVDDCELLNTEVMIEGVQAAIAPLKSNKPPGCDGFPGEVYKA